MKQYFTRLFHYDLWASTILLDKFDQQFPQNERIYVLTSHILNAQHIWLNRFLGLPQTAQIWAERLPAELRLDMETYHLQWLNFIDQLAEADFSKDVNYTAFNGVAYTSILTDIIVQVLNHGTHHRGEVMILMKEEGFVLPNIDYITFTR